MNTSGRQPDAGRYEIRLQGHLEPRWSAWLDGMDITPGSDGTTVIHADAVDQSALHGLLSRLHDIGLPLISIARVEPGPAQDATTHTTTPTGDRHVP